MYGVNPDLALRVAKVESGTKTQEFRVGRLGATDLWGPGGIRGRYHHGLDMAIPHHNILIMVRALHLHLDATGGNVQAALCRYNPEATPAYLGAVGGR